MNPDMVLNKQFLMAGRRIDRIIDLYTTFNPEVDVEAFKRDGYIEPLDKMMEPITMSFDDHAPEVVAYWAKLGLVKEFHGADKPMDWTAYEQKTGYRHVPVATQNKFKTWNSFVPVSAFKPENKDKKYPVVVVLHGGMNPISIIDGWGFPQEAARREWIVICPTIELDDVVDEVLAEAAELYPIDESRIYVTGFSYGGFMTNTLANKRPDVYAAAAPCGVHLFNGWVGSATGPEPQTPYDGTARCTEMNTYMPVMNVSGILDGHRYPIYDGRNYKTGAVEIESLLEGVNHWCRANRAQEFKLEDVMAMRDRDDLSPEEKNIGLPLPKEAFSTVVADGITNHFAEIKSADGVVRTKIMVEMNTPHWPTPELSRQVFEFFSHFSRDRKTGESIYTP